MASFLRKAMVYIGLVDDDEYDEYEVYDDPAPARQMRPPQHMEPPEQSGISVVRPMVRDEPSGSVTVQPRSAVVRPVPIRDARPHVVVPKSFNDAQEIGDRLKAGQPVIVNLQGVDQALARRMIDFCSGSAYVLGAQPEKVADRVLLVTPANVEVSADEKRRLHERGYTS